MYLWKKSSILFVIYFFALSASSFALKPEPGEIVESKKSHSSVTLTKSPKVSESQLDIADPFHWQIHKHYEKLIEAFHQVSELELSSLVNNIITVIKAKATFFEKFHKNLIRNLKETMHGWLIKDVISTGNYYDDSMPSSALESDDEDEESGEDAWRSSYMRGHYRDGSEYESGDEDENNSSYEDFKEENTEEEYERCEEWKLGILARDFNIHVKSVDEFRPEDLSAAQIRGFLKDKISGGSYSWLINEIIEGNYETSDDFIKEYVKELKGPPKLLSAIFGGLWFNFDWEEFDIEDPNFLPRTYISTLEKFMSGSAGNDLKETLKTSITKLLCYNPEDFEKPFEEMREKYNQAVSKRDWQTALVQWSVYSTYIKVFKQYKMDEQLLKSSKPLVSLSEFNGKKYLYEKLEAIFKRAQLNYTKVYPHPDTSKVVYGSKNPNKRAVLLLKEKLSKLKQAGLRIEKYRPVKKSKQTENILVPKLYFVVSDSPHEKGGNHSRKFVSVKLPKRFLGKVLTKDSADGVFTNNKNGHDYFIQQAKKDYVAGQIIRGLTEKEAEDLFTEAKKREGELLNHSERVWLEILRDKEVAAEIVNSLRTKMAKKYPDGYKGKIRVYSVLSLLYSTNSICKYCTPSLIAAQNGFVKDGFLFRLSEELNKSEEKSKFQFKTRGFDEVDRKQDPAKFRFDTIVTAKTNFDSQAHDLTEKGQHCHTTIGKNHPPENHLPEGTLVFPKDEIDIHQSSLLESGQLDPHQKFFYEFVGKDMHLGDPSTQPYDDIVCSSGGKSWSKRVSSDVLKK